MNALDAYEHDMQLQPEFLDAFVGPAPIHTLDRSGTVFAGSGDSFAASMLAESFSGGAVRSMDPRDLYRNQRLCSAAYFVSVSGRTVAGILAAKAVPHTVAVTADPDSALARSCRQSVLLRFPSSGVFTAGSASFLSSSLTCMSLVRRLELPSARPVFDGARAEAGKARLAGRLFVLGNYYTYPVAMYCAAKFYEVLGADVRYCRVEQFFHMELFAAREGDTVILFDGPDACKSLGRHLRAAGLNVCCPGTAPADPLSQVLFFTFFSQFLSLFAARREEREDCYFVLASKLRGASNAVIY